VNSFERLVRFAVIETLRDFARSPSSAEIARRVGAAEPAVVAALHALADEHRLALIPGTDAVWMAHPFSAVESDFVVHIGDRRWYANCVWDGLAILALLGDGVLDTRAPGTGAAIQFEVIDGQVIGAGLVHFLVPARSFWDDIGFT
jgi:hypothetical protein